MFHHVVMPESEWSGITEVQSEVPKIMHVTFIYLYQLSRAIFVTHHFNKHEENME